MRAPLRVERSEVGRGALLFLFCLAAPDLFLEGARRLGRAPGEIIVFEDARLGIQAARAAGMRAYGITTGEQAGELLEAGATAAFPDFTKLPRELLG